MKRKVQMFAQDLHSVKNMRMLGFLGERFLQKKDDVGFDLKRQLIGFSLDIILLRNRNFTFETIKGSEVFDEFLLKLSSQDATQPLEDASKEGHFLEQNQIFVRFNEKTFLFEFGVDLIEGSFQGEGDFFKERVFF